MTRGNYKAIVLAAIASSCGYAAASTISVSAAAGATGGLTYGTPGTNLSLEGAAERNASSAALTGLVVAMTMGAFQSRDSIIQLALTNAKFASVGNGVAPSVSCTSGNIVLDVGAPTASNAFWDFGITGTSGTTSNVVCTFSSLGLAHSSITGTVSVSAGVKRTSDTAYTYDSSTASAVIITASSQIGTIALSTAFNGVVDYQAKQGYGFVTGDGGSAGSGDILAFNVPVNNLLLSANSAVSLNFAISAESGKTFSFLDSEACGTTPNLDNRSTNTGRAYATFTGGSASLTINASCTTLTYAGTAVLTGSNLVASVELGHKSSTPSTGVVIEPMTFPSFVATVTQGAVSRKTGTIAAGSWTSNGATVVIPYMPINLSAGTSAIDPVVTIANRSSLTGVLSGTMRDEDGNSCALDNLGSIAATRTKNLGGLIKTAFAACSNLSQTSTERMYITITATLPDSTTTFYSGYNVGGTSRVTVVNSSNGK